MTPLLIAHRGASFDAPENTLAAFRLAWETGADGIEGDFHLTRDGHIVCLHDKTTKRTAGTALACAETDLTELRSLEVGGWFGSRWRGEPLPTLEEVLDTVPPGKRVYVEIKCGPEILPALEQTMAAHALDRDQIVFISFNERVIAACKKRLPDYQSYWLVDFDEQAGLLVPAAEEIIDVARRIGANGIACRAHPWLDHRFVARLRLADLSFHVWTINTPRVARRFARLRADSITTDRPGLLRREWQ